MCLRNLWIVAKEISLTTLTLNSLLMSKQEIAYGYKFTTGLFSEIQGVRIFSIFLKRLIEAICNMIENLH